LILALWKKKKTNNTEDRMSKKMLGNIMKEAQKLQTEMAKVQEEAKQKTVEATAGGGMVTVLANGGGEIVSIKIERDVVDPEDVEMLQDLIMAATNEALRRAQEMVNDEMSKLTGGLQLPGLGGLKDIIG
jgi:DNA-binding YbaB/EbfC family protein